jgi:hypothetical protein
MGGRLQGKNKKFKILIFRGSFWGFFFENLVLAHTEFALFMFTFELICMLIEGYLKIFTLSGFFLGFLKILKFLDF